MGLSEYSLRLINSLVQKNNSKNILFLSCPDLLVNKQQLEDIFQIDLLHLKFREDSEEILHWHAGYRKKLKGLYDTDEVFKTIGWDCTYFDLFKSRGPEIQVNLNENIRWRNNYKYDLVVDNIVQHCFNIGQAMENIIGFTKIDGYVFHLNPCMMPNNGFYNLNPEFYHNFYLSNGFSIEYTEVTCKDIHLKLKQKERLPSYEKFRGNVKLIVIVKKKEEVMNISWPIQYRFQEHPLCKF